MLEIKQGTKLSDAPNMPPCWSTSVPRSWKISASSWMPDSISRISDSRSWMSDSWCASSCGDNCRWRRTAWRCSGELPGSISCLQEETKRISCYSEGCKNTDCACAFSSSTAILTPSTTVRCRSMLAFCARWKAVSDSCRSCEVFCRAVLNRG
jgi:hypothetical protein